MIDLLSRQSPTFGALEQHNPTHDVWPVYEGALDLNAAASDCEYLTPQEIAEILKVSVDTIVRKFERRKGVINLGSEESRFTRRYRVLRIPRRVFEAYVIETSMT